MLWENMREDLPDGDHISIFDKQLLPYHQLQEILVKQNTQEKFEQALEISEKGRNSAFISLLAQRNQSAFQSQRMGEFSTETTIKTIQDIAKEQNATLIEYSLIPIDNFLHPQKNFGQEALLYIWVVKPTGEIFFKQVDLTERNIALKKLIPEALEADIGVRGRGSLEETNQKKIFPLECLIIVLGFIAVIPTKKCSKWSFI